MRVLPDTSARGGRSSGPGLAARRRDLSLVDVVSFLVMRREGLTRAFTLDPHFSEQGFECIPGE